MTLPREQYAGFSSVRPVIAWTASIFIVNYIIDTYATREEKDDSDECEVAHERSEGAKTRVRIIVFLSCSIHYFFLCMHRNGHFFHLKRNTRKMSVRIFDKDKFATILGYYNAVIPEHGSWLPHQRCLELIVSSSFNQPMAVGRGRSHELVGSMVGAASSHVLGSLLQRWSWMPILSSFRNELTFWSVRCRHLMLQKLTKKSRC